MANRFPRGSAYPREQFVQESIARWFVAQGFEVVTGQHTPDVLAHGPGGKTWHVEAKGHTADVGLDFRTGLGQLLQGMHNRSATHAMAMPGTPQFRSQCARVPDWVRSRRAIWWLFVAEDGSVEAVAPGDEG